MELQQRMVGIPAAMVLMAAILIPAPSVASCWTPPAEPVIPILELAAGSVVTIGDGFSSQGAFTGTNEMPFVAALASLPDGGEIVVGAGTYIFRTPVNVLANDVLIRGEGATLLSSAQLAVGLFEVTGDDVRIEGIEMVDHLPGTGHSLVRVTAERFQLTDCTFRGRDAHRARPTFVELRSHSLAPRTSASITSNEFHPHRGWTLVQATRMGELNVTDNTFMGNAIGERRGRGFLAYGLRLDDVTSARIHGNVFFELGDTQSPVQTAIEVKGGGSGHVVSVESNVFHRLAAQRALHFEGVRHQAVRRNAFGNLLGAHSIAIVDVDATSPGNEAPIGITLESNRFESTGGGPAVRINGGGGHLIVDNNFDEAGLISVLTGDSAPAQDVKVLSNDFSYEGVDRHDYPAILLLGGAGHVVHSNSLSNYASPGIVVEGGAAEGVYVSENDER
jgi:hypothetical protein